MEYISSRKRNGPILIILIWGIINVILLIVQPEWLDSAMRANYNTLVASSFGYLFVLGLVWSRRRLDIFEPYVFVSALHIMLYLVAPIRSILVDDMMHKAGVDVFAGCQKGTWIALSSFTIMTLFYEGTRGRKNTRERSTLNRSQAQVFAFVFWGIGFLATFAYLAMRGKSLLYILSLGNAGEFNQELTGNSSYAFFSVIANIMYSSWLLLFYLKPKSILTWAMFFLTMSSLIVRGFRIFIVVLSLSPVILYYLRERKRPGIRVFIPLAFIGLLMIGFVGWARGSLRSNVALNMSNFGADSITSALWGNFDIYKTYYGIMNAVPSKTGYTFGGQMIGYTLLLFIPRALWPSKPQPPIRDVLRYALNDYAVTAGAAYPALGEWYHEFGIIGCLLIAAGSGYLLRRLSEKKDSRKLSDILLFATLLPALLQLVIRGYTPSNFWMILTMLLPVFIIRSVCGDLTI